MTPVPPAPAPVKPGLLAKVGLWWSKLSTASQKLIGHVLVIGGSIAATLATLAAVAPALHVPAQYVAYVAAAQLVVAAILKALGGLTKKAAGIQ